MTVVLLAVVVGRRVRVRTARALEKMAKLAPRNLLEILVLAASVRRVVLFPQFSHAGILPRVVSGWVLNLNLWHAFILAAFPY